MIVTLSPSFDIESMRKSMPQLELRQAQGGTNGNNGNGNAGNNGDAGNTGNTNAGNNGNTNAGNNGNTNAGNNGNTNAGNNGNTNAGNNGNAGNTSASNAGNNGNNRSTGSSNAASSAPMSGSASQSSSVLLIPQTAAAGGISMTQPPATATSYYKIAPSQVIVFGWNMTSVIASPTHLTISAVADNGNTYPVGPTDGIIPASATQVTWDIYSYQQHNPNMPLEVGMYTLNIYDERGPGAGRAGGYLSPFNGLQFALYTPHAYTPIASGKWFSEVL